jgi:hypothetical protein
LLEKVGFWLQGQCISDNVGVAMDRL